jgi:hypothetical protein
MTFSAGKIAARLVDGKIVLGPGKMDRGDEPVDCVMILL